MPKKKNPNKEYFTLDVDSAIIKYNLSNSVKEKHHIYTKDIYPSLDKLAEKYPKGITVPLITNRLTKEIVSVDGNDDLGYISQFVSTLPIMDSKYIKKFLKENVPQIDLTRQTYAPSGELVTFSVSFGVDFFRPFF